MDSGLGLAERFVTGPSGEMVPATPDEGLRVPAVDEGESCAELVRALDADSDGGGEYGGGGAVVESAVCELVFAIFSSGLAWLPWIEISEDNAEIHDGH